MPTQDLQFVLASGSPRRKELLSALGISFKVRPSDVDESLVPNEAPETYVERLALSKAQHQAGPGEIVLAADTIVVLDQEILGKPVNQADAREVLARLQGREHLVLSGVAIHLEEARGEPVRSVHGLCRTTVRVASMSEHELDWYSRSGEPDDKAGSYGIQGLGALFVEAVDGNYTNVVGLPVPLVKALLAELGIDLIDLCHPVRHPT